MTDRTAAIPPLRIFQRQSPVQVLGPGQRAVLWVQGCPFACKGCLVPESWDETRGETADIAELTEWICAQEGIEGVTFSGGEPMVYAAPLAALMDCLRARRDLGLVCYTGYTWEHLRTQGNSAQQQLLAHVDLLIDGVYVEAQHANLLWRGSSNQRLVLLSDRYRDRMDACQMQSAGLEFFLDSQGAPAFAGIPPDAGFRKEFETRLSKLGITIKRDRRD